MLSDIVLYLVSPISLFVGAAIYLLRNRKP